MGVAADPLDLPGVRLTEDQQRALSAAHHTGTETILMASNFTSMPPPIII
jgi:hypothetical protein